MHPVINKLRSLKNHYEAKGLSNQALRNFLKEYLQDIILHIVYNDKDLRHLIFYRGTCLRKIFGLNRVSEDLDFESSKFVDLEVFQDKLLTYFRENKLEGVSVSAQRSKEIVRITIKFQLLSDLGLSPHGSEKLHVKVEINEKPTGKYKTEKTVYAKDQYFSLIKHYPLPTLMAGKIVACLQRSFKKGKSGVEVKGRDFYDLVWFMQKRIIPDEKKLLDVNPEYSTKQVFRLLDEKIRSILTKDLLVDLEPLFSENEFIRSWCADFALQYKKYRKLY